MDRADTGARYNAPTSHLRPDHHDILGRLMSKTMETTIKIDGVEYPVRQTMAALVDFREATGKEAYEITGLSDACRMLYYQVRATAEADGREFDMDFRTFALRVTPEDIQRWGEAAGAENAKGSKKKTTVKK